MLDPCQDGSCTTRSISSGGFQTSALLSAEGHRAVLSGHLDCAGGTHYVITVDVEQEGQLATGRSQQPCRSGMWSVPCTQQAAPRSKATRPGPAPSSRSTRAAASSGRGAGAPAAASPSPAPDRSGQQLHGGGEITGGEPVLKPPPARSPRHVHSSTASLDRAVTAPDRDRDQRDHDWLSWGRTTHHDRPGELGRRQDRLQRTTAEAAF